MARRHGPDLDEAMNSINEIEARDASKDSTEGSAIERPLSAGKTEIGRVEDYFSKISVAAIKLTSHLSVGDLIEIGDEEEHVRQRVESMQIEKEDVSAAFEGDSVGIKIRYRVPIGSSVYRIDS